MEERPPIWGVAANILNKQSRTVDKGWFYYLGAGRNNSKKRILVRNVHTEHLGPGVILWYDLSTYCVMVNENVHATIRFKTYHRICGQTQWKDSDALMDRSNIT